MSKRNAIIASILLIMAAIVIQLLIEPINTKLKIELIEFFSGLILGVGIAFLFVTLFKKK
ncbi:MAG: hypothetical protein A2W99_11245 [Bacteroidetes bacterium GWF2_33_16]|nr:MAG: hypothetical protein A2X00_04495 [Bacteroidetes bacterium GWE2_32_14]OFY04110.1 MAG: hypothetical protein A2W99_11245 [Bacteroidetes bacterium GWF2_33_16]OFY98402.1 MAG: hypothetical protein A2491_14550 [Bacteroidetes bacterium RIFOXYC12_FULL_35_7]